MNLVDISVCRCRLTETSTEVQYEVSTEIESCLYKWRKILEIRNNAEQFISPILTRALILSSQAEYNVVSQQPSAYVMSFYFLSNVLLIKMK